jgi:ribonuclease G
VAASSKAEALLIQMNPRVSAEFTRDDARVLRAVEEETGKWFHFEGSEGLPLDHFAVVLEGKREEVLERAVPFREGEEVFVEIVEPHMYSPGDAVAKVDGYMISITGGERFVGEKHLVRIEDAGRTSAVATLVDVEVPVEPAGGSSRRSSGSSRPSGSGRSSSSGSRRSSRSGSRGPEPEPESESEDGSRSSREDSSDDALESGNRRRGRRGGRRRSGARAESAQAASSSSE